MKFILAFVVLATSIQAYSGASTYMILCRENGGNFKVFESATDQIAFCKFDKTLVRAETLANYIWFKKKDSALNHYVSNNEECNAEQTLWIYNDLGKKIELSVCKFDTDLIQVGDVAEAYVPMIDKDTVKKSASSPDNAKFNAVLDQVFP